MSQLVPKVSDRAETQLPKNLDERSIGSIISQANNLTADQIEQVLAHQRKTGQRFGEAAVELGMIQHKDVVWALAQQYNYPYRNKEPHGRSDELIVANEPFSDRAELFRNIRSQLLIKFGAPAPRQPGEKRGVSLSVISANRGDGKTFIASNLALSFAQLGGRVALVDADLRNARIQSVFEISDKATGLSEALNGRAELSLYVPAPEFGNLYVLPTGIIPPNPQELVERADFSLLIAELRTKFDYVIIDTPAAEIGIDYIAIAAKCENTLLVARKHVTDSKSFTRIRAMCERAGVNVVGTVLNEY